MRKFSVFLGIILFVQILYSCTSPIIPYSIDAKKEDPPLETLSIGRDGIPLRL